MPKYVLSPDGSIKDLSKLLSIKNDEITEKISKPIVAQGGSHYAEEKNLGAISNANLPFLTAADSFLESNNRLGSISESIASGEKKHIIGTETVDVGSDNFVSGSRDDNFLANPSFGGDENIQYYKNFNNYLGVNEIFASELEMAAGLELSTFGFKDITKLIFMFDYILEASVYIAAIEGILAVENFAFDAAGRKTTTNIENDYQMELGNYGPINYSALTRYIHEHLRYPKDKRTKMGFGGIAERLGAFYVGLSFYVNSDPLLFIEKFSGYNQEKFGNLGFTSGLLTSKNASLELLYNMGYYIVESILNLSSIGSNRLLMLVRRFNQKSDWVTNKLYKAKSNASFASGDNPVEKFMVELNHYYVTFIIERINIGLKAKKYYKNNKSSRYKLNRSGRAKDSITGFSKVDVTYTNGIEKVDNIKKIDGDKRLEKKQSISISALPQAFIMPKSMYKSSAYNGLGEKFLEEHVKNYFIKTEKPQQRLSNETVKKFEAFYEKEMVPFYFQDLRTNEILGFHAFVESYSDSFSPQYNETAPGYGRVDKVYHYMNTSRQIQVSFMLVSMSKEDHDLMWYQINKLVSMVYPQWSRGFKNTDLDPNGNLGFEYPFTQVPTASPLIRMRFGDVFKSNYTKHAINKIHGMGQGKEAIGFDDNAQVSSKDAASGGPKCFVLPGEYYYSESNFWEDDSKVKVIRSLEEIKIIKETDKTVTFELISKPSGNKIKQYQADSKSIIKHHSLPNKIREDIDTITVDAEGITVKKHFEDYVNAFDSNGNVNNPLTAAYETTLGKGLAGFIGNLGIQATDALWETQVIGSKAPMSVKIDISFNPIHDIAPGLDADGMMRAPVYNTGKIINSLYGDVYED